MPRRPVPSACALIAALAGCSHSGSTRPPELQIPDSGTLSSAPVCAPLPALDSVALMGDLFRLADDSMGGRLMGSPGNLKARDYLAARFDALGLETPPNGRLQRIDVNSTRFADVKAAWNVLGIVRGTTTPDKWIVLTAHYDHVGFGRPLNGDSLYNGSDDNASGAAALAVMAQYFQHAPLSRSILFAAVDGEEVGMFGSRGLVDNLPMPIESVELNVNLDMISRNDERELYAAGTGPYPALRPMVEAAVACAPVRLRLGHDTPAEGRANNWTTQSDHASFHRSGIPFLYFGVEDHEDYHRPGDSPDKAMPDFYVDAVRTVIDVMRRF